MGKVAQITQFLRMLLGVRITQVGILVWPDEAGVDETDVRLHLAGIGINDERMELTIGTGSDGQTPMVEMESWPERLSFPLEELQKRKAVWSQKDFWSNEATHAYELFYSQHGERSELSGFLDQVISKVFILVFASDQSLPTGVSIEFAGGQKIWSIPSAYGNRVTTTIEKGEFPEEVVEIEVP